MRLGVDRHQSGGTPGRLLRIQGRVESDVTDSRPDIPAAGGLVVRGDTAERLEVAIVHRPRYGDWSLPKGKVEPGEDLTACALREIHEETGLLCRIVEPAGTNRYPTAAGMKQVDYFLMRPYRHTGFTPGEEVDDFRWLPLAEAAELVSYPFDRELIESTDTARAVAYTTVHLVRHGAAGDRREWNDDDQLRPLTPKGRRQADAIARQLSTIGVSRVLSSPYIRCVETVQPLAEVLGSSVEADERLAEGASPSSIRALLDEVAGSTAVLCSHGDVIPETLRILRGAGVHLESLFDCKKGSTWMVTHDQGFKTAAYFPPPEDREGPSPDYHDV